LLWFQLAVNSSSLFPLHAVTVAVGQPNLSQSTLGFLCPAASAAFWTQLGFSYAIGVPPQVALTRIQLTGWLSLT